MMLLIFAFVLAAGAAKGLMDGLNFHYWEYERLFKNAEFWNPAISWRNKGAGLLRRTALVFLTDGWHLTQFIFLSLFQILVLILYGKAYGPPWWHYPAGFLALKLVQAAGFYLTYKLLPLIAKGPASN